MNTKTSQFLLSSSSTDYDVVSLTETWLKPSVFSSELFSDNYIVYRNDRSILNSTKGHGGGVLIAVKSIYRSEVIVLPNSERVEIVCVKVFIRSIVLYVCCIYIPSNSDKVKYDLYNEFINQFLNFISFSASDIVLILGDFNFPHIDWLPDPDIPNVLLPVNISNSNSIASDILDTCFTNGLFQINNISNIYDRTLDLVFSSDSNICTVSKCDLPLIKIDVHHTPVDIVIDLPCIASRDKPLPTTKFDFKNADWNGLNTYFLSVNWLSLFEKTNINDSVDYFYNIACIGIEYFVPKIVSKNKKSILG